MAPSSGPFFSSCNGKRLRRSCYRRSPASRVSPGIAVGHVVTGRAPPKIALVRQVIGVVAGISLSERWVPGRRIIIGLRRRARNDCGGQSSSQKKFLHDRLRNFRFIQELRTHGWEFAFLSPFQSEGAAFLSYGLHLRCVPEASRGLGLSVADDHELGKALRTAKP
jgi:hypothetical protein